MKYKGFYKQKNGPVPKCLILKPARLCKKMVSGPGLLYFTAFPFFIAEITVFLYRDNLPEGRDNWLM
jgi:hypothetical protein